MAENVSFRSTIRRFFGDYVGGLGGKSPFGRLIQRSITDDATRRKLVESPALALAEAGVVLRDELKVEVLQNSDRLVHIVLPPLLATDQKGGRPS